MHKKSTNNKFCRVSSVVFHQLRQSSTRLTVDVKRHVAYARLLLLLLGVGTRVCIYWEEKCCIVNKIYSDCAIFIFRHNKTMWKLNLLHPGYIILLQ